MVCDRAGAQQVLTTSRDNTLRLYDSSLQQKTAIPHNNNTGPGQLLLQLGRVPLYVCR